MKRICALVCLYIVLLATGAYGWGDWTLPTEANYGEIMAILAQNPSGALSVMGGAPLASPALTDSPASPGTKNGYPWPVVLYQNAVQSSLYAGTLVSNGNAWTTAPTSETVVGTFNIPAGAMGLNGCIRLDTLWSFGAASNTHQGNTAFAAGNYPLSLNFGGASTSKSQAFSCVVCNRNNASSQVSVPGGFSSFAAATQPPNYYSVNTANAVTVNFTASTTLETSGQGDVSVSAGSADGTNVTLTTATNNFAVGDYVDVSSVVWQTTNGSASSCANVNPVKLLAGTNSTTVVYADSSCNALDAWSSGGTVQRYTRVQLEYAKITLEPGAN